MSTETAAVLGLHVGLNASAALVTLDGRLVWAEQEERHSRQKNHCGFPTRAIQAAVVHATQTGLQIEAVAVGGRTVFPHDMTRAGLLDAYNRVYEAMLAGSSGALDPAQTEAGQAEARRQLAELLPGPTDIRFLGHHHCHAAAAYNFLRRDNDPYLIITLDGEGDDQSGSIWTGTHGELTPISTTPRAASAGLLYFWVTYLLGLQPHEDEHKVMGLAGHVDPERAHRLGTFLFAPLLDVDEDTLQLVVGFPSERVPDPGTASWMQQLADSCQRVRFDRLAGAVQAHVENLATRLVTAAIAKTGIHRVMLAGGVAMNVKLNRAVRLLPCVDQFDVMPSAGDESLSIGAAYLAATDLADRPLPATPPSIYLGTHLTTSDTDGALDHARHLGYRIRTSHMGEAAALAARAILDGEPVAVCHGRAEFGARALGHRSLLADPSSPAAVAKLNAAIKRRDFWMPFAPVLHEHHATELLSDYDGQPSPWMTHAYAARHDERLRGAVHPTDWTCRPQTLDPASNEPASAILHHVNDLAGLPALINTSANQHGEPIIRTAHDAVGLLERTPLRYLLIGSHLIEKPA